MRAMSTCRSATRVLTLAVALASGAFTEPALAELDAQEAQMGRRLREHEAELWQRLQRWVAINTGSHNLEGLEQLAREIGAALEALGFEVERRPGEPIDYPGGARDTGPVLLAHRPGPKGAPRWLLSGHLDTVFERSSPFQTLGEVQDGRARGPGAADMKGGLVVMLSALEELRASGDLERADWRVLLVSDEELGSLASRPLIEAAARTSDLGFVFESAREDGSMVRSRRGLGQFIVRVEGVAAHAGSAHRDGRSAIVALARKVLAIESLTDYRRGITLNTGIFRGGSKRNIVPGYAEAWIDLRYDDPAAGRQIRERIEAIAAQTHVAGTHTSVWGSLHRPPKLESEATRALLEQHARVAHDLGLDPREPLHAGGGTDGSLMAAVGLTTLDSMGVRGGGAHTPDEFVVVSSLAERAALTAILWRRLLDRHPEQAAGLLDSAGGDR
jgi:glutamate carboxypeptidase